MKFEHGAGVVIQATHQPRCYPVGRSQSLEAAQHRLPVLTIFGRQCVQNRRRVLNGGFVTRIFGIEDAQRVVLQALLGVLAERFRARAKVFGERGTVRGAALQAADGIYGDGHVGNAETTQKAVQEVE